MKLLAVLTGFLSLLVGSCSKPHLRDLAAKSPPEITADSEDGGYVDLVFAIRSHETLPDGSQALRAYGVHQGREVGITVVLGPQWKKGSLGPNVPLVTSRGTVTYHSLGGPSDTLLHVLDRLYETNLLPTTMRPDTTFTGISLGGDPGDLAHGPTKIKMFFESSIEDRYAELYTNIDLEKGVLQIHEKDPEYRAAIIHALRLE
jgi:hypothetical protein